MSNLITEAFVQQYQNNVIMLYQQMGSKLRGLTRMEAVNAKYHYFERLGATAAVKKTVRHGDTPLINSQHSRRRVGMVDYEWADLVDIQDKIRLLITPESEYAVNAAMALGRAYDEEVIAAFNGTSYSGETGGTSVAFPAGQKDTTSAGCTTARLITMKKKFDENEVPDDNRFFICSPAALEDLLNDTQAQNSDYNTIKALVRGEINTWLGFQFLVSTLLPLTGSVRSCFAWHPSAMGVAMGMDLNTKISERSDKSYAVQVYVAGTFGATRIQEEGVYELQVTE